MIRNKPEGRKRQTSSIAHSDCPGVPRTTKRTPRGSRANRAMRRPRCSIFRTSASLRSSSSISSSAWSVTSNRPCRTARRMRLVPIEAEVKPTADDGARRGVACGTGSIVFPRRVVGQFAAFCFVLATMMSCHEEMGGSLPLSAANAVHRILVDVARMRADPLLTRPGPMLLSIEMPAAPPVPNSTVAPGATEIAVKAALLRAPPPAGPKTSTPIVAEDVSAFVHARKVPSAPVFKPPGTAYTSFVNPAGSGLSTMPENARVGTRQA